MILTILAIFKDVFEQGVNGIAMNPLNARAVGKWICPYRIMVRHYWYYWCHGASRFTQKMAGFFVSPPVNQSQAITFAKRRLVMLLLGIIILAGRSYVVYGQSMEPTIYTNEHLIIERISYLFTSPARGDVVVIDSGISGKRHFIKRVVGLASETIAIRNGRVYINDKLLHESYLRQPPSTDNFRPITIPPDHIFVLGDNRSNSNDSRAFGCVHVSTIKGRALLAYWPLQSAGLLVQ